jgi:hypothetical protein
MDGCECARKGRERKNEVSGEHHCRCLVKSDSLHYL